MSGKDKRSVYGVGYLGYGEYKAYIKRKPSPEYKKWSAILRRCYSEEFYLRNPSYIGCTVHEDWHNFQVFAEWYTKHESFGLGYEIDKDILVKDNKQYGEGACCLVPKELNLLLNNNGKLLSKYYQGVYLDKTTGLYKASMCKYNTNIGLGYFKTPEEAHEAYIKAKSDYVEEVVSNWVGRVEGRVLDALLNWNGNNTNR